MQVLTAPASFGHSDCERIVGAALAQPVLAVTSLAYVAAGMAVLCWAMRVRAPLAGAAGVALVAVGAGSFVLPRASAIMGGARPRLAHHRPGTGVCRRPCLERAPAALVNLGDGGRRLRAGTGCLRRGTHRLTALPARQSVAVPRRLARPLRRCRRLGRPGHGAGPARGASTRAARLPSVAGGPVDRSPADSSLESKALESSTSIRPGDRRRRITAASRLGVVVEEELRDDSVDVAIQKVGTETLDKLGALFAQGGALLS